MLSVQWTARILLIVINIPAVIMSAQRYDVLSLFLVADLVCACAVLPLFLGLITEDKWFFAAPTELGAVLGSVCGVGTVLVNGAILNFTEAINPYDPEDVWASGPFAYFWLTNGAECALCGPTTMWTFIVTTVSGGVFTLLFSKLDVMVRGERARKPLLRRFDEKFNEKFRGDVETKKELELEDGETEKSGSSGD